MAVPRAIAVPIVGFIGATPNVFSNANCLGFVIVAIGSQNWLDLSSALEAFVFIVGGTLFTIVGFIGTFWSLAITTGSDFALVVCPS